MDSTESKIDLPMVVPALEHHLRPRSARLDPKTRWMIIGGVSFGGLSLYLLTPDDYQFLWAVASLPFCFAIIFYMLFSSYRWNKESKRGEEMLQIREFEEAIISFDDDCRSRRGSVSQHAQSMLNLAIAQLMKGDHKTALSILAGVEQYPGVQGWSSIYERIPGWMSLAYALKGDLLEAKAWLEEGERRCDETSKVLNIFGQAVVYSRQNESKKAVEALTRTWTETEISLLIFALPDLRMLRAFALHQRGRTQDEDEIKQLLDGARGAPRGSYDYLGTHWPDMANFIGIAQVY